ncbi:uncharacterized protein C8Q71DRAFT_788546 [Rhodofomes roseus]|uniref:F-box domain-containing protein n=1 Tax=Rhodofomes roseus TaxID=34475 RepID=A0ABQ8K068_9APHY|nr:uncharacterized protein C8Q71DRAFT_788546 [Rhodofomes roseus]KAH9829810.1 hypothetical protein C8Q71DRAFT_788546 [Rhodofomes roseus]
MAERNLLPPLEILAQIILFAPREARRTCLLVSRLFHDLAIPMVFSRVTIHLGAWERWCYGVSHPAVGANFSKSFRTLADERGAITADILHRIMVDRGFAKAVRRLEILAFNYFDGQDSAFQLRCLSLALKNMYNLRSLVWYGGRPLPSPDIVNTLAEACLSLHEIALPCPALERLSLRNVKSLDSIVPSGTHMNLAGYRHDDIVERSTIDVPGDSLREICIPGSWADVISSNVLPALTCVELLFLPSRCLETLGSFLAQLSQLRSLTMDVGKGDVHSVLLLLASSRIHHPRLTSLCLLHPNDEDYEFTPEDLQVLPDILSNRCELRRLRLLYTFSWSHRDQFLGVLHTLKNVEVLELVLKHYRITRDLRVTRDVITSFAACLPSDLAALALTFNADIEPGSFEPIWSSCPQLEYFHVRSFAGLESVEDLVTGSRNLKVIGRNDRLHGVEYLGGNPVVSDHWPESTVMFRRAELYECPGWEWLTRHTSMSRS